MIKMVLKLPIKSIRLIITLCGIVFCQSLFAQQQIKRLPQVKMTLHRARKSLKKILEKEDM